MALFDGRRLTARAKRKRVADYYAKSGILDLLLQWAREEIPQEEQAGMLNSMGHVTSEGTPFNQPTISRIIKRAQEFGQLPMTVET